MKNILSILLVLLTIQFHEVKSLDILGVFPYQGKSHFLVFEPYLQELARRGHNVTVISYFPQTEARQNYTDISLAGKQKIYENVMQVEQTIFTFFSVFKGYFDNALDNCITLLDDENVQYLVKSRAKFDVILVEAFFGDCALALAHKIGGPVIALTSHMAMPHQFDRFGIPDQMHQLSPTPNFLLRLRYTLLVEIGKCVHQWFVQNKEQDILSKYYDDIPQLEELARETKLMLVYTHYSLYGPKSWPENVKEVGGYHVMKSKPLPDKLKDFIEQSKHGVIYVSFGSMVKASTMPQHKLEAIIAALSELPQRVVWKWEEESLPGNPKNIYLSKWLPQNDILAHPNVVAFFSHCGLLGTTEAMHHGVPMVGMPILAEQPFNALAIERIGFGVRLLYKELTKETLLEKFKTVLSPEFRERAKEISRQWHDRPMSAMDTAIFWTEYVARNPNSTLRTRAVGMPRYQIAGYDILFVTLSLLLAFIFTLKYLIVKIFGKKKTKSKKD